MTIAGTENNDTLIGNGSDDVIDALGGDDLIEGAEEWSETIFGGAGRDTLSYANSSVGVNVNFNYDYEGDQGGFVSPWDGAADTFFGIERVVGSAYEDSIYGGSLHSLGLEADGGEGDDYIVGGQANDTLYGGDGADYLSGGGGSDSIHGGAGDDVIDLNLYVSGFSAIDGGDGRDRIVAGGDIDLAAGTVTPGGIANQGTDATLTGIEDAEGSWANDFIRGDQNANVLIGDDGADTILGGGGNDTIYGYRESDDFPPEVDNDVLNGEAGDDYIRGGPGSGTFIGGSGNDTIDGGSLEPSVYAAPTPEEDPEWVTRGVRKLVDYADSTSGVTVNLATGTALDGMGGIDTLININFVRGSAHHDAITGSSKSDKFEWFEGGAGNDTIDGGAIDAMQSNNNRVNYGASGSGVNVNLGIGTASDGQGGIDTLININQVNGSSYADTLIGSERTDVVEQFYGGAGYDTIHGQGGEDRLDYTAAVEGISASLAFGTVSDDGQGGSDTVSGIEHVRGTSFNDTIAGNNDANKLEGANGADLLSGAAGNDTLIGGGGNDTLVGGAGDDLIDGLGVSQPAMNGSEPEAYNAEFNEVSYADATAGVSVNLATGSAQDGSGGIDTLLNIQAVRGSDHGDVLTGSNSTDTVEEFEGGAGDDAIDGQGGLDVVRYGGATGGVTVNFGTGVASGAGVGTDTLSNVEGVAGSSHDDTIAGGSGFEFVDYAGSNAGVTVSLGASGSGSGGSNGTDTLINVDGVRGSTHNDTLTGSEREEWFAGGLGQNTIDGGDGVDLVDYQQFDVVNFGFYHPGVIVDLSAGTATNQDNYGPGSETDHFADSLVGIENVRGSRFYDLITGDNDANKIEGLDGGGVLNGGGGNDTIIGGAVSDIFSYYQADFIDGGDGDDSLMGGAGTDYFRGGSGDDFIDGGVIVGDDVNEMSYSDSTAGVVVNLNSGTAQDGLDGNDTLININSVQGSDYNDTLIGSATANRIETFIGGDGVDHIDGGLIDAAGSNGNLLKFTENYSSLVGVVVNLGTGQVTDEFGNFETIANINMVRSTHGDDLLIGSDTTDYTEVFYLTEGNDTIDGMGGEDMVSFRFGGGGNLDLAEGTADAYGGVIQLSNIEHFEGSDSSEAAHGSGAANWMDGRGGDDWIAGRDGDDTLIGGAGADSLEGGLGNDLLVGGDGLDVDAVYYWNAASSVNINLGTGVAEDGDSGTDTLVGIEEVHGSQHADTIVGSNLETEEWLYGHIGDDNINGGGGNDLVFGDEGNDTLQGGGGHDRLTGGTGDDVFRFNVLDGGASVSNITDFGTGNDRIEFDSTVFTALTQTGALSAGNFVSGNFATGVNLAAQDENDHVLYDTTTGSLYYDQDGNGAAEAVQIASLRTEAGVSPTLTSAQIFVIDGAGGGGGGGGEGGVATEGDDTLIGGAGDDVIDGLAGNDSIDGGAGNDFLIGGLGADIYVGGDGYDTVSFMDGTRGVRVNLVTGVIQNDGFGNVESISGVEGANGSRFGDVINAGNGHVIGSAGNDNLIANWVNGGSGSDTLTGFGSNANVDYWDDGFDTAGVSTRGVVVNLSTGVATDNWGNTDRLSGFTDVTGSLYADRITGNAGNNGLFGGSGNDTVDGGVGNDHLEGWSGNDSMMGGAGNDYISGGSGNDVMLGGAGSDTFEGGSGNDTMDGGAITDPVNLSDLNLVTYAFASGGIVLDLGAGTADDDGDGGRDTLININFVVGSEHGDIITGTSGTLFEQFEGRAGADTIDGGVITSTNNGTNRVTYLAAPSGINANLAAGLIEDGYGDIDQVSNIQSIRGSIHGDTMVGSDTTAWTEVFEGRAGNDTTDGAGGIDMVRFDAATTGVNVNFATGVAQDGQAGTDTLSNIEGVRGSAHADTLTGRDSENNFDFEFFQGGAGNDTIDGGAGGYDRVDYVTATAAATVTLGGTGAGTALDGQGGTDTLINIEAVRGSSFKDRLTGSDSGVFESFEGMAGNDTINGMGGIDRADYVGSIAGVKASLLTGVASDGFGGTDRLLNIENLGGSLFADILTGNAAENKIDGRGGNDAIDGKGGFDRLDGGEGSDIYLVSAAGDHSAAEFVDSGDVGDIDEVRFTAGAASTLDLYAGDTGIERVVIGTGTGAIAVSTGTIALNVNAAEVVNALEIVGNAGANRLIGTVHGDTLKGGAGADRLDGGVGADSMEGGSGKDTYVVDDAGDLAVEVGTLAGGIDTVESSIISVVLNDVGANLENITLIGGSNINGTGNVLNNVLTGNAGNNQLFGDAGNDTLNGGEGGDTLDGGTGADSMVGGLGNDTYVVDSTGDRVVETTANVTTGGIDAVQASISYTLGANVENLVLTGIANLNGTGNTLANVIEGNVGNNVINGKGGVDDLDGEAGSDIYMVTSATEHTAAEFFDSGVDESDIDEVRFAGTTGTLTLYAGDTGIERVVIGTGTGAVAVTTGTSAVNVNASLVVNALEIVGNAGANILIGGLGADTLLGGKGNDTYVVDDVNDVVVELAGQGADLVKASVNYSLTDNVEKLTLEGSDDLEGAGNVLNNVLTGNAGNNQLFGDAGNDTLMGGLGSDSLDGGAGADSMVGGAGDDIYRVDLVGDRVVEVANGGIDKVFADISYTLGANLEHLELNVEAGAAKGTGNALNNVIIGNEFDNVLNGAAGNDTITGGDGNDIFRFASTLNAATNVDTIEDFASGVDKIQLENSIFTRLTKVGGLVEANFYVVGSGAQDANDYIVYDADTGVLSYDRDGSGTAASAVAFAELVGQQELAYTDFLVS